MWGVRSQKDLATEDWIFFSGLTEDEGEELFRVPGKGYGAVRFNPLGDAYAKGKGLTEHTICISNSSYSVTGLERKIARDYFYHGVANNGRFQSLRLRDFAHGIMSRNALAQPFLIFSGLILEAPTYDQNAIIRYVQIRTFKHPDILTKPQKELILNAYKPMVL